MNPASQNRSLGEYRLIEQLAETPLTRTWLAEQVSVSRRVLVDELRAEQAHQRDAFLADVRAKAAVEHPLIGSVYEAVAEPGLCYFAHELLPGTTLTERIRATEPFPPARLTHLLRRVAEAHLQQETLGQATSPLGLRHLHLDDQGVLRLDNLAIAGTRAPEQTARDIVHLGQTLPALVAEGQPGTTRLLTLLGWMRGEGLAVPLTWDQVREICAQIEQQLATPLPPAPTSPGATSRLKPPVAILAALALVAVIGALTWFLRHHPQSSSAHLRAQLPAPVLIPAGPHPTPDGPAEELKAYRIGAHEVTIGQYAEFLETLDTLAKDHRERTFDHENQPPEKTSHLPDEWPSLLAAAKANGTWHAAPVTLDCPVVGVDWWDGTAYAEWKQVRLATQEEWFAALRQGLANPTALKPAEWVPVTSATPDHTPNGLVGMAGSVCEWTRRPTVNPANPLGERQWVIVGGSFLKPGSNALTREWTDNRSLRRRDLGFRVVLPDTGRSAE
ncbi:MAG: SUMF1/EgtB/PvdO family nonheme iron enzyme [Verrucomicrobiota bacterium]